jgi:hypothetical protein
VLCRPVPKAFERRLDPTAYMRVHLRLVRTAQRIGLCFA